jgi:hypothetical protein
MGQETHDKGVLNVRNEPRPVFLIVDSHPAHLGQRVIDYVDFSFGQFLDVIPSRARKGQVLAAECAAE